MLIEKNRVVSFHYRLSEADGGLIEDSRSGEPLLYLHGHHGLFPALEEALAGKGAGERIEVRLTPEQAYGPRRENAQQRISKSHVVGARGSRSDFRPGMTVQVNTSEGPRSVVVTKVGLKTLDVDANHPLAGRALDFAIEVLAVREASEDEIAHGHAHGDGGHAH